MSSQTQEHLEDLETESEYETDSEFEQENEPERETKKPISVISTSEIEEETSITALAEKLLYQQQETKVDPNPDPEYNSDLEEERPMGRFQAVSYQVKYVGCLR